MWSKIKILGLFLVIVVLVATLAACGSPAVQSNVVAERPSGPADKVQLVLFHFTQRCYTCNYAEAGIKYTLDNYFKDEQASGKVTFAAYNIQDKKNAAVVKKYKAYGLSVYCNTVIGDAEYIEPVTNIWLAVGNDQAFVDAVVRLVETSLKGAS